MVVLVQEMIYTCNLDEVDESRKKEVLVMAEDRNEEDADPGEKETWHVQIKPFHIFILYFYFLIFVITLMAFKVISHQQVLTGKS